MDQGLLSIILHWIVSALALLITAYVVPGFKVKNFKSALIAALLVGLANAFIRPILMFLAFPLNVLTLGLFTFVVNACILKICASIMRDFEIRSWFSAILGALILALVGTGLHMILI